MARKTRSPVTRRKATTKRKTTSRAAPVPTSAETSMSVRKINNGYIISESGDRGGKYFHRETFTPQKPKVTIAPAKPK